MAQNNQFDEVAFQTLWAEGLDPLTSAAASIQDQSVQHAGYTRGNRFWWNLGLIAGLALWLVWELV